MAAPTTLVDNNNVQQGTVTAPIFTAPSAFLPSNATQVISSSGNKAATSGTAVISGVSGKTSYLTGFDFSGAGATATSIIAVTASDGTWVLTYEVVVKAGVTGSAFQLDVIPLRFAPPLAASATNTAITVTLPSLGAGSTNACVTAYGYQQ